MDVEIYVHHGQVLRELINNYGISINEFASYMGLSRQNIYNMYGIKVIKRDKLEKVNQFFASKFANYNPSVFEVGIDLASNDSNNPVKKLIDKLEGELKYMSLEVNRYKEDLAFHKKEKEHLREDINFLKTLVLTKLDRLERLNFGINEGGGLGKIEDILRVGKLAVIMK